VFTDSVQDVRQAARSLGQRRVASVAMVSVIGLAIAINTTVFSVVSAVLLQPQPYAHADRLVRLWFGDGGDPTGRASLPELDRWQRSTDALAGIAAYRPGVRTWADGGGRGRAIAVAEVSWAFFEVMGARPTAGRVLLEEDQRADAPPVVVVSERVWGGQSSPAPRISQVTLDGVAHDVVGVMPAAFAFPDRDTVAWLPIRPPREPAMGLGEVFVSVETVFAVGRLVERDGLARARAEARAIFPDAPARSRPHVASLREADTRPVRNALLVLQLAVLLVLGIGSVNVAHLLMARSVERRPEFAVRTALGASPRRIVRQWAMEGLLLAGSGGALSLLLTAWGISWVRTAAPPAIAGKGEIALDSVVLLFCLGATAAVALLTVAVPAVHTLRLRPEELDLCRKTLGTQVTGRHRGRRTLIAAQVALALALLITTNALVRSFLHLTAIDTGFQADGVAAGEIRVPGSRYAAFEARAALLASVLEHASPAGLRATALASSFPLDGLETFDFSLDGQGRQTAYRMAVSDAYFRTLGIAVVQGRSFAHADTSGAPPVVVVSRAFAAKFLPGADPLERRLVRSGRAWDIVGVVSDVHGGRLTGPVVPVVYFSYRQLGYDRVSQITGLRRVVVFGRAEADAISRLAALGQRLGQLDPALTIDGVGPLADRLGRAVLVPRFLASAMSIFSAIALVLAGLGVAALVGYSVAQRLPEFGLRLALGAGRPDIYRAIAGLVVAPLAAGGGIGTAGGFWLTRGFREALFGVSTFDVVPVVASLVVLVLAGMLACLPAARRATAVDPAVVLRQP
jgi:putative ABC transport system permease protein